MIAKIVAAGSIGLFLAVSAGAFGAHALRDRFDEYARGVYEKAVFYHFVHAMGLILVGIITAVKLIGEDSAYRISLMLVGGIVFFSGSLYLLALLGMRWLGAITPIGGSLFLVAWAYLAYAILRAE